LQARVETPRLDEPGLFMRGARLVISYVRIHPKPFFISVGGAFLFAIAPVLALYLPLVVAMSGLARKGKLPAFPALWAANALLLAAGIAMYLRLARR